MDESQGQRYVAEIVGTILIFKRGTVLGTTTNCRICKPICQHHVVLYRVLIRQSLDILTLWRQSPHEATDSVHPVGRHYCCEQDWGHCMDLTALQSGKKGPYDHATGPSCSCLVACDWGLCHPLPASRVFTDLFPDQATSVNGASCMTLACVLFVIPRTPVRARRSCVLVRT